MIIRLPTPPSVNSLYATSWKTRRRFISKSYADWRSKADAATLAQGVETIRGEVVVDTVVERPKDRRRRDLENYTKALSDHLVRCGAIEDDSQIIDSRIRWGDVEGCEITVTAALPVWAA